MPDPATSPRGPMVVRVYDFPDGRRVTVYQRPGSPPPSISSLSRRRGIGTGALAYGDEPPPGRRVFILPRDQLY